MFTIKHVTTIGKIGETKLADAVKITTDVVLAGKVDETTGKVVYPSDVDESMKDVAGLMKHYGPDHVLACLNDGLKLDVNQHVAVEYKKRNDPAKRTKALREFTKFWGYANQKIRLGSKVSDKQLDELLEQYKDEIMAAYEQQE